MTLTLGPGDHPRPARRQPRAHQRLTKDARAAARSFPQPVSPWPKTRPSAASPPASSEATP